jgi:DNA-binding transcriptional LysR family regulator
MVEDRIDLAIRVGPVNDPDAVVRRVASTPLVCVGSRRYFEQRGIPKTPADLVDHNCFLFGGLTESANWPFVGPEGRFSVSVRGNLSSNSFMSDVRDVSLIWPKRRFVPARVRRATDFFATALPPHV